MIRVKSIFYLLKGDCAFHRVQEAFGKGLERVKVHPKP